MKLSSDTQNTSDVSCFRINRGSANLEKIKRGSENLEKPPFYFKQSSINSAVPEIGKL
jgi:hypothetical protein